MRSARKHLENLEKGGEILKKRLSKEEYQTLAKKQRAMKDIYWEVFRIMTGCFPKNSKAIKKLLSVDNATSSLYYETELEFFRDFPDSGPPDFSPPIIKEDN